MGVGDGRRDEQDESDRGQQARRHHPEQSPQSNPHYLASVPALDATVIHHSEAIGQPMQKLIHTTVTEVFFRGET